jgi:hypothetical protein
MTKQTHRGRNNWPGRALRRRSGRAVPAGNGRPRHAARVGREILPPLKFFTPATIQLVEVGGVPAEEPMRGRIGKFRSDGRSVMARHEDRAAHDSCRELKDVQGFLDKTREAFMPRGDKSSYSDKQKRKAEHIEQGYKQRGVSEDEAERRAWATVNKIHGGGEKSGSGRGKPERRSVYRVAGKRGGKAAASRPKSARSASARKAARTRARRGT